MVTMVLVVMMMVMVIVLVIVVVYLSIVAVKKGVMLRCSGNWMYVSILDPVLRDPTVCSNRCTTPSHESCTDGVDDHDGNSNGDGHSDSHDHGPGMMLMQMLMLWGMVVMAMMVLMVLMVMVETLRCRHMTIGRTFIESCLIASWCVWQCGHATFSPRSNRSGCVNLTQHHHHHSSNPILVLT